MNKKSFFRCLILVLINISCCFHSKETVIEDIHELLEQKWCNTANSHKKIIFRNGICEEFYKDSLTNKYSYTIKIGNKGELGYHFVPWTIIFKSIPENVEKVYKIVSAAEKDILVLSDKSKKYIVFNKDCKETEASNVFKSEKLNL